MKTIPFDYVVDSVEKLVMETSYKLPGDVLIAIKKAREKETSELALFILDRIIENADIASSELLPICQDTGAAVFFADIGDRIYVDGDGIEAAINEGTRRGYKNGALRMSMVKDPLRRVNTQDNSPAIIHFNIVEGEELTLYFCPKAEVAKT